MTSEPITVPALDLGRYLGVWYEIARLPMRHEKPDWTDITATYTLNDAGNVRVRNRALDAGGELKEAIGEAVPVEDSGNAKLRVSFLPEALRWIPFTRGDYWVLRIDAAYRTALVGAPDRDYLWLLHRDPTLAPDVRDDFLATARAQGYALDALILTPQTGRPTA